MELCLSQSLPMAKTRTAKVLRPTRRRSAYRPVHLKEWLEVVDMSQAELAAATEYSESHLSLLANGKRPYNQELLETCGKAMGIDGRLLLYPPPAKPIWAEWSALTEAQQMQAVAHLRAIKGAS